LFDFFGEVNASGREPKKMPGALAMNNSKLFQLLFIIKRSAPLMVAIKNELAKWRARVYVPKVRPTNG